MRTIDEFEFENISRLGVTKVNNPNYADFIFEGEMYAVDYGREQEQNFY